jgi:prepilin-type N-terminal cleavage/methylation domain-containing protein
MKLTNTQSMKAKSGMTLLELTVVILVLLSLISILFVGARAWKKGSDRAANIMNIRNVQQAVRGQQNMRGLAVDALLPEASIVGDAGFLKNPTPPDTGIIYDGKYRGTVPASGVLYLDPTYTAPLIASDYHPEADAIAQW